WLVEGGAAQGPLGDERHFQALHEVDQVEIAPAVRDAGALIVAAAVGGAKQPDGDGVLLGPVLCLIERNQHPGSLEASGGEILVGVVANLDIGLYVLGRVGLLLLEKHVPLGEDLFQAGFEVFECVKYSHFITLESRYSISCWAFFWSASAAAVLVAVC